ncbi:MAG: T9SS type A sorting domain-containing protein [Bacteroidia bacterium]|nr:T9SS type A sorting domain-containing protein [Bacteroidia bacterium]
MKIYSFFLLVIVLFNVNEFCYSQNLQWAKSIGSNSWDRGRCMAIDRNENCFLIGQFNNTADFDPGLGTANLTSFGLGDIFFAKYAQDGSYLWANNIGSTNSDIGYSIDTDYNGNCYITGYFKDTVDFDPGLGTSTLISFGGMDIFIAKYAQDGTFIWAKNIGSTFDDIGQSIAVDSIGNCYITGYFTLTADFNPGIGISNLTSIGESDIFFAKYDSNGNYLWAKSIGSSNNDYSYSIAIDNLDNCYITGGFYGNADFDPSTGTAFLSLHGYEDVFFAKYGSDGSYLWAKNIGNSYCNGSSIAVDSIGSCYITGNFYGTVDFDPSSNTANLTTIGNTDIFISKYATDGTFLWAKNIGGSDYDYGQSLTIDRIGNCYITGHFANTVDFDPGTGVSSLTSFGGHDIFFAKFEPNGNFLWAKNIGGTYSEYTYSITVDDIGSCYITGYYTNTVDFDPNTGITNLISVGYEDVFFAKYDISTGANQLETKENELFRIYPSPATEIITITNNINSNETIVSIFDFQGKQIINSIFHNEKSMEINVNNLVKGIYLVKIQTDKSIESKKLVIQ